MHAIKSHEELVLEQQKTLQSQRLKYGLLARLLFLTMDFLYGKKRTLEKFKVLEIIARVPYQAWENVGYIAVTHSYIRPRFARRVFDYIREARSQQDNEQWHLLILEEQLEKRKVGRGWLRYWVIPQIISVIYYHISWILYVIRPRLSYLLNAHFEDHAEHEYMEFVRENPQFENEPFESAFAQDYGNYATLADLLRQIGLDERHHKDESLARLERARFGVLDHA